MQPCGESRPEKWTLISRWYQGKRAAVPFSIWVPQSTPLLPFLRNDKMPVVTVWPATAPYLPCNQCRKWERAPPLWWQWLSYRWWWWGESYYLEEWEKQKGKRKLSIICSFLSEFLSFFPSNRMRIMTLHGISLSRAENLCKFFQMAFQRLPFFVSMLGCSTRPRAVHLN